MKNYAVCCIFKGVKKKLTRLKAIQQLIGKEKIKSQDVLLKLLFQEGFNVTQATLSRDLRTIGVGKISDGQGSYVYSLPGDEERKEREATNINDFLRGCISIDWSGNVVVIKTYSGHADPVAMALESFNLEEVLGTIAGKDTIAVFLRQGVSGEDFMIRLKANIPGLN